jgi:1,4-dihydroxy-2-naphthoate octaprenyltransferase
MRRAMIATFALAVAVGGYLAWVGGWPIVAIGVASIAAGVALHRRAVAPRLSRPRRRVRDDRVLRAGRGRAARPTSPLGQRHLAWRSRLSVPVGAIATAIIVVNNLRDAETDARVRKRTLAVRFGRRFALAEYAGLLALAHAVTAAIALWGRPLVALGLATAPLAVARARALARAVPGPEMNALLAATAQLLLLHAAAIAVALALA